MRSISTNIILALAALVALSACGAKGTFRDGVFLGQEAAYRVDPPAAPWERVSFAGNDLAWAGPDGELLAVNAVCQEHGDPSLKVLTDHLLMGFENRRIREREEVRLAGRSALRTRAEAQMDGVPVELELTVLKKDGCVYDLTYLASPSRFDARLGAYRAVLKSFEAVAGGDR
ncbi:hypothetical protein [Vulgatibacter incomptus]|uniref:Lipoprotein n=1 Tax=Vulgatibacter incomptus TaxID=1391653 RepID=A0A0K1PAI4_9BACT|nr:hypothetical protein [Vulgatibacter incomptus]AKU90512.1 hypothetical protein AKJ08_0899 [Vulgatibacter incomptus]